MSFTENIQKNRTQNVLTGKGTIEIFKNVKRTNSRNEKKTYSFMKKTDLHSIFEFFSNFVNGIRAIVSIKSKKNACRPTTARYHIFTGFILI